jgi:hypothetical protein
MSAESYVTELTTEPDTDYARLREQATVDVLETIPLPRDRVTAGDAFAVVTDDVTAWPDQTLNWRFEYNDYMDRWLFECEHESLGMLFNGRHVATLGQTYSAYPYMMARFEPTAGTGIHAPDRITPRTLGETVALTVAPGPAGGSFLDAATLTQDEQDALLGRHATDYPVTEGWV